MAILWAERGSGRASFNSSGKRPQKRVPLRYLLTVSYLLLIGVVGLVSSTLIYTGLHHILWMAGKFRMEDHLQAFAQELSPEEQMDLRPYVNHRFWMYPLSIPSSCTDLTRLPLKGMDSYFLAAAILDLDGHVLNSSRSFQRSSSPVDPARLQRLITKSHEVPQDPGPPPPFDRHDGDDGPGDRGPGEHGPWEHDGMGHGPVEHEPMGQRLRDHGHPPGGRGRHFGWIMALFHGPPSGGELREDWQDDQDRQLMLTPLARDGQLVGFIETRTNWEPNQFLLDRFLSIVIVGLLVSLGGTVLLSIFIAKRVSRPLEGLAEAAHRVASGDLTTRTHLSPMATELYEVSSTFDSMVERLQGIFALQQRFVADASHELKTPLATLEGQIHIVELLEERSADPRRAQALVAIDRELRRMDRLVSDLLTLSKAEQTSNRQHPFSLSETVQEALSATLANHPGREIHLENSLPDMDLLGDEGAIEGALRNLLDNAIKHTPTEARVTLRLSQDPNLAGEAHRGFLRLAVIDQGCGIPAEHLPRLGQRFYRVDKGRARLHGGTGLGLSIVRAVAEKHGGRLEFESAEGRGTTATVLLPPTAVYQARKFTP